MRFGRWRRPTAYRGTPRKCAACPRMQRLEREALRPSGTPIAAKQHSVDQEMAGRWRTSGGSPITGRIVACTISRLAGMENIYHTQASANWRTQWNIS